MYAGKLRELVKKQGVDRATLSPQAFFALAKHYCARAFVAALNEEQLELASTCDAWFVFGDAGLAMVPYVGTAEKAKAAHALECVNVFATFVGELSPRHEPLVDPLASGPGLLSWCPGGDAGVGGSGAAGSTAAGLHRHGCRARQGQAPDGRKRHQHQHPPDARGGAGGDERAVSRRRRSRSRCVPLFTVACAVVVPSRRVGSTHYFAAWIGCWPVLAALLRFGVLTG